jgi:hypothetical protein
LFAGDHEDVKAAAARVREEQAASREPGIVRLIERKMWSAMCPLGEHVFGVRVTVRKRIGQHAREFGSFGDRFRQAEHSAARPHAAICDAHDELPIVGRQRDSFLAFELGHDGFCRQRPLSVVFVPRRPIGTEHRLRVCRSE